MFAIGEIVTHPGRFVKSKVGMGTMQRFGEKVRVLRKQRAMTLRQLADALGLASFGYLSEIETGKKTPHPSLIIKIADVFGVTVDQLMRDELELDE
jgi:transcriptional regulator with XRE-family HTH domain